MEHLESLIADTAEWVWQTRVSNLSYELKTLSDFMDPSAYRRMRAFFLPELFTSVRIAEVEHLPVPPFAADMPPADLKRFDAICLVDLILVKPDRISPGLLFHEMVHADQYRQLGLEEFVRQYLTGYAEHGHCYHGIPLERQAYLLEAKWRLASALMFDVADQSLP